MKALPAIIFGGLIAKLFSSGQALAQDGAAVVGAIKATWDEAKKIYDAYSKVVMEHMAKGRAALEGIQTVQSARKYISDQEAKNRQIVDQFNAFGKDPLGVRLPSLSIETMPLFRMLSRAAYSYDALAASNSKSDPEKAALYAQTKAQTGNALGKNEAVLLRGQINKLEATTGKLDHAEKSKAQLFGEQAAPITNNQLQAILECLLRMEEGMNEMRAVFVARTNVRHAKYTALDAEKAKERYKKGFGTLADSNEDKDTGKK